MPESPLRSTVYRSRARRGLQLVAAETEGTPESQANPRRSPTNTAAPTSRRLDQAAGAACRSRPTAFRRAPRRTSERASVPSGTVAGSGAGRIAQPPVRARSHRLGWVSLHRAPGGDVTARALRNVMSAAASNARIACPRPNRNEPCRLNPSSSASSPSSRCLCRRCTLRRTSGVALDRSSSGRGTRPSSPRNTGASRRLEPTSCGRRF
jgi:hypothetical protein